MGLHGDRHITDVDDLRTALTKMNEWGFHAKSFGYSMPDSVSEENKYKDFVNTYHGKEVLYIRKGSKNSSIIQAGQTIRRVSVRLWFAMKTIQEWSSVL